MDSNNFEGSVVLEMLARIDAVDEFMAAVDSEDVDKATELMRSADIGEETIATVLEKMVDPYDEH